MAAPAARKTQFSAEELQKKADNRLRMQSRPRLSAEGFAHKIQGLEAGSGGFKL